MNLDRRIDAFARLGNKISGLSAEKKEELIKRASDHNPWFTPDNISLAIDGILPMLHKESLQDWLSRYPHCPSPLKIGVVMAGNIPLVGFHDFLSVLIAGHNLISKLSSSDDILIPYFASLLIEIEPAFEPLITFADRLNHADAVIATGSNNTSRYFEYYFRHVPHIIRKNRSSCAVITGEEKSEEITLLGHDIFSYYGLGCRNVSKIFIPKDYELTGLLDSMQSFKRIIHFHKYANNYDYQKSIMLVNQIPFLETEFILLTENVSIASPIAVLYYEYYENLDDLTNKLTLKRDSIQCVVSSQGWYNGSVPFGQAQFPKLWDYADGVDTIEFLLTKVSVPG